MNINFGSIVKFPDHFITGNYANHKSGNLIEVEITRDHMFPNDEVDTIYGLTDATSKVTLVASEGRYRSYWRDLKEIIARYNPDSIFKPYPQELIEP